MNEARAGRWRIPFRVSLLALSLLLVAATAGTILAAVYVEGRAAAERQASQVSALTASAVRQRLTGTVDQAMRTLTLAAQQRSAFDGASGAAPPRPLLDLLFAVVNSERDLYSAYFGSTAGAMVQVIAVRGHAPLVTALGAPDGTHYVLRQVSASSGQRLDRRRYFDAERRELRASAATPSGFDPRQRPWFAAALETDGPVLTPPYRFHSLGQPGITLSHAVSGGVLGVDVTIAHLQTFVRGLSYGRSGELFLFDDSGQLWTGRLADGSALDMGPLRLARAASPALQRLIEHSNDAQAVERVLLSGTEPPALDYVSRWAAPAGNRVYIAMSAPLSDFTGFLDRALEQMLPRLQLVLLLVIPLAYLLSRGLSRPLQWLSEDARRLATFDFSGPTPRQSMVSEIQSLNTSFTRMASALQTRGSALAAAQSQLRKLVELGIALSSERDPDRLMEAVLLSAKQISNADGGTLYLRTEDDELRFIAIFSDSLGIALGGSTGKPVDLPPVPLRDAATGEPNHRHVAAEAVHLGEPVNIADVYAAQDYDFSGTRAFDASTGYRSISMLTVPMKNRQGRCIGVLQLLNARHETSGAVQPFADDLVGYVSALATQAAVTLENAILLREQRRLMDAFIELLAGAIDAKSPYTGGHCNRVPQLAHWLADAASSCDEAPFDGYQLDEEARYEFHIAAWLHDCGKVTTPEYVVDKATKLETVYNRIHEVRTRFEVLIRDAEVHYWRGLADGGDADALARERDEAIDALRADFEFLAQANRGGESMSEADQARVRAIAGRTWSRHLDDTLGLSADEQRRRPPGTAVLPVTEALLDDKPWHVVPREDGGLGTARGFNMTVPEHLYNHGEVYNLCIQRGTLTAEERFKINDHIVQTIVMLEQLPFPPQLARVPEIAGGHHETMDGRGYPRGLTREQMSISARILAIADIFEALTAADRPYKPAKPLSEALSIMAGMRDRGHIDPDLFDLFLRAGIHERYADEFLQPEQKDAPDLRELLGARH